MREIALASTLLLGCWGGATAAEFRLPDVSFTAEARVCFAFNSPEECTTQTIYYTPTRVRIDERASSGNSIVLYDAAKKIKTEIDFAEKSSVEETFDAAVEPLTMTFLPWPATWKEVGREVVVGADAVKYAVSRSILGTRTEGFAWLNAQHIVMRAHVTITGLVKGYFRTQVTKLTIGAFDDALLDVAIPADFTRRIKK